MKLKSSIPFVVFLLLLLLFYKKKKDMSASSSSSSFLRSWKDAGSRRVEILAKLEVVEALRSDQEALELRNGEILEALRQTSLLATHRRVEREKRLKAELCAANREVKLRNDLSRLPFGDLVAKAKRAGVPCAKVQDKLQLIDLLIIACVRRQLAKVTKKRSELPTLDEEDTDVHSITDDDERDDEVTENNSKDDSSSASSERSSSCDSDDSSAPQKNFHHSFLQKSNSDTTTIFPPWPLFIAATLPAYYTLLAILVGTSASR